MSFFPLNDCTLKKIERFHLEISDKIIISRCVWGYSPAESIFLKMQKIQYRWNQCSLGYPDWNRALELLNEKEFSLEGAKGTVVEKIVGLHLLGDGYLDQKDGLENLLELLK